MPLNPALRDPMARRRLGGALLAVLVLWPLLHAAQVHPGALLDPANLRVIGGFLAGFLPPETGPEFRVYLARATLETLAIATAGMLLAGLLAVPLAYVASSAGRERRTQNPVVRGLLTILRSIPELVWALLFVRVLGLGPAAGVLALALTYGGMLAKVYAEILESTDPLPAQALRMSGASRPIAILYGLLPQASKELASYTVYRWECAIRASVVMGFVGAGGLGQLMDQAMKMLNGGEAATILATFMLLVLGADALSGWLRRALDTPSAARASPWGWRSTGFVLASALATVASFQWLDMPLRALWSGESLHAIVGFVTSFFPLDLSAPWLRKIALGTWETLAMSVVGTLLAAVAGLLLALPKVRWPCALVLNTLRSVPELVWATITVLCVGLGPFAGALALGLHTAGVLGRLYAEALANAPPGPARALRLAGASGSQAFLYGTLPGAAPQLIAYTLYRWEMNIRMAAILGFVGAGGLGQLLYFELSLFHYAQAATVILAMLLLSVAVDQSSAWLRRVMR
jgi:phosphonate transport system permease protein